jgi:beta-N-acetylhexosaminidase
MAGIAESIEHCLQDGTLDRASVQRSIERVRKRKALLG